MTDTHLYGLLMKLAVDLIPLVVIILLASFIIFLGLRSGRHWNAVQEKQTAELQRQTALLERIATAVERQPPNSN
jgi:hypothetical protein